MERVKIIQSAMDSYRRIMSQRITADKALRRSSRVKHVVIA
jgi:hypothetical protein